MHFTQQYVTVSVFQPRVKVLVAMKRVTASTTTANVINDVRALVTAVKIMLRSVRRMKTTNSRRMQENGTNLRRQNTQRLHL